MRITCLDQLNVRFSVIILELVQINFDSTKDLKSFLLHILSSPRKVYFYIRKSKIILERCKIQLGIRKPIMGYFLYSTGYFLYSLTLIQIPCVLTPGEVCHPKMEGGVGAHREEQ